MVFIIADDRIEYWDMVKGRRLGVVQIDRVDKALPSHDGFVTLAQGKATLWLCEQEKGKKCVNSTLISSGAKALDVSGSNIMVSAVRRIHLFSLSGKPKGQIDGDLGVSAMLKTRKYLVLGFNNGSIELRSMKPGKDQTKELLVGFPGSRVVSLAMITPEILAAGFAHGVVGLWDLKGRKILDQFKLHGPVVHLAAHEQYLYATTSVGSHLAMNLGVFFRPYCGLLNEIWKKIPITWMENRPVLIGKPETHPCLIE